MGTMRAFVAEHRISISCEQVGSNPNMNADEAWARSAYHYKCTLRKGSKRLTVYYSMGSALTHEPTVEDVLDSMASDSSGYDNAGGFLDWAREFGMEWDPSCEGMTEARAEDYGYDCAAYFSAKRTYKVVGQQADKLRAFLGPAYKELLYDTDRL